MELSNEFEVAVPVDEAWALLTDVERIAPCMPGARLTEVEGDEYRGTVKVKVGPITAQYKGVARFVERDAEAHRAVLRAEGRDTRGQGNANATITATLAPAGAGSTAVSIATDLTVTGKVAQFGRGVMADVSVKLLDQFATCLHERALAGDPAQGPETGGSSDGGAPSEAEPQGGAAGAETTNGAAAPGAGAANGASGTSGRAAPGGDRPAVRRIDSPEAEPVNLLDTAGGPLAKRLVPALGAMGFVALLLWLLRARRR